jgi:hypothetical protein
MRGEINRRIADAVPEIARAFGLTDRRCARSGRLGACERAVFGDCACPEAMEPGDETTLTEILATLIADVKDDATDAPDEKTP